MRRFSACVEMLFADEASDFADCIRLAGLAGFDSIEFWRWTNKDIDVILDAVAEAGVSVTSLVAEPMISLTDAVNRQAFLKGLKESVAVARRLGAGLLIAQAGDDQPGLSRASQRDALVACLRDAAGLLDGTGIVLGVEPLNTLVDHKGYFLPSTVEALDIIDDVASSAVRIVYDLYHSAVMGEDTASVLNGRVDRLAHVHVADHPGRHQPGSGTIDLRARLDWLFANGYSGPIGLEYRPVGGTSASIEQVLAAIG
jgi:hydroxypyruvate isomerase